MSTKGADNNMKEKRGRSPSLPRKVEIGQQRKSPSPKPPSIQERKKAFMSMESRKTPTHPKPLASSSVGTSARNTKNQPFVDKTNQPRRSLDKRLPPKATSTQSKPNKINVTTSSTKTVASTKSKDVAKPRFVFKSSNSWYVKETSVGNKKQTSQPIKGIKKKVVVVTNKPNMSEARLLSKDDQNVLIHEEIDHIIVTHEKDDINVTVADNDIIISEDLDKQFSDDNDNDILHDEVEFGDGIRIPLCESLHHIGLRRDKYMLEYTNNHDNMINQEDQTDETTSIASGHFSRHIVNQENQESDDERVTQEVDLESVTNEHTNADDQSHEDTNLKEVEQEELIDEPANIDEPRQEEPNLDESEDNIEHTKIKEDGAEVPKAEDTTSKAVTESRLVVVNGKKDTVTYNYVIEKTVNKLREQRKNRVKALASAFETVILLEANV